MSFDFRVIWGDLDLTDYPFMFMYGSEFGAPENVSQALAGFLVDGEIEATDRVTNRTLSFTVGIEGTDLLETADAERALAMQSFLERSTLVVNPGDGFGPASVFKTFRASLVFDRDDNREQNTIRLWNVTLRARPWVNSLERVQVDALLPPTAPTFDTVLDDGSSATNWSTDLAGASVSSDSAAVIVSSSGGNGGLTLPLIRTGLSELVAVNDYLRFDNLTTRNGVPAGGLQSLRITYSTGFTTGYISPVATVYQAASNSYRLYFKIPTAGTVTAVRLINAVSVTGDPATYQFTVDNLGHTNVPPFSSTKRQQFRTLAVEGSAPTEADIVVAHATTGLGDVLAFTWADDGSGYLPPLQRFRTTSDSPTADTSTVSGSTVPLTGLWTSDVPIAQVPQGIGWLFARLKSSTVGTFNVFYTAATVAADGTVLGTTSGYRPVTFTAVNTWQIEVLAQDTFRAVPVKEGSTAKVRFTLQRDAAISAVVTLDEAWNFNFDRDYGVGGVLTQVSAGANKVVSIESPSVDRPEPGWFIGTSASDRSTWRHASINELKVGGIHRIVPESVNTFTVTTNVESAMVSADYPPAWHTHAATLRNA